tara:strand:- start:15268 stop:16341 length:1074 start_codon:yes stop_codon:yes gene_type:complete
MLKTRFLQEIYLISIKIMKRETKTILITGAAGFIGFHLSKKFLEKNWRVVGIDCISSYYDVKLKYSREKILKGYKEYVPIHKKIEEQGVLYSIFEQHRPRIVVHLAAQAGVRHSICSPREYLDSNIRGSFELLEAAKNFPPDHILFASTSSVYGANRNMPYRELDKADHQISFYAATKKSVEAIAHSYSHLFQIPITIFRFFTVYGPWGRPDMAYFKFTKSILEGSSIDVYNNGVMKRDFTFIDDLIAGIILLSKYIPSNDPNMVMSEADSLSRVAPYRLVNIGNSSPVSLKNFIASIEKATGIKAKKKMMPMQPGDVTATWADGTLLHDLTGFTPNTDLAWGIQLFVDWYRTYYKL